MDAEHEVVGRTGFLVQSTRGPDGPGEAMVAIRGTREAYTAWSTDAMAAGEGVLVVADRGHRNVDVVAWPSPDDVLVLPENTPG